jgi:hypothetical protein
VEDVGSGPSVVPPSDVEQAQTQAEIIHPAKSAANTNRGTANPVSIAIHSFQSSFQGNDIQIESFSKMTSKQETGPYYGKIVSLF